MTKLAKLLLLLPLLCQNSFAKSDIYKTKETTKLFKITPYRNVYISHIPVCLNRPCIAKKVVNDTNKSIAKKFKIGPAGLNPTSPFCHAIGGIPQIYYRKNLNNVSICLFQDDSFILSWDLFNKVLSK